MIVALALTKPDYFARKRPARLSAPLVLGLLLAGCSGPNPAFIVTSPLPDAAADLALTPDLAPALEVKSEPAPEVPVAPEDASLDADLEIAPVDLGHDLGAETAPELNPAPPSCPADPALLVCLPFAGDARDHSSRALATTTRNITYGTRDDGSPHGVLGAQSRIELGPNRTVLDTSAVTIEAWVRLPQLPRSGRRMGIIDYTRQYAFFVHPNGDLVCTAVTRNDDSFDFTMASAVPAGVWTHVACTAGNGEIAIWTRGRRRVSTTIAALDTGSGADTMVVGGNYSADEPDPFEGDLDEVRVWNQVRSAAAICQAAGGCPD